LLVLVVVVVGVLHSHRFRPGRQLDGSAIAPQGQSTITSWLENAWPIAWDKRPDRIIINRRLRDGMWGVFSIRPNRSGLRCITCLQPSFPRVGVATNRGASDLSPDGRYLLLVVEKGAHDGTIGETKTQPGKGVFNDIWLATLSGSRMWRLTDIPVSDDDGIIFPRFDRTGHEIVWAQMYNRGGFFHPLGEWELRTARLVWRDGTPHLAAIRTYDAGKGHFFEPYGFTPDDKRILFASDARVASDLVSPSAFNSQIYTLDAAHLDDLQRVSPAYHLHGMFSDYNEFAFYLPGVRNRLLVARTYETSAHGMDYWTMSADGADPRRITFMNQPGTRQYLGYSQALNVAFDPHDPRRFLAGVSHDLGTQHIQAVMVTLPR
jgi:hypothetical protein